MTSTTTITTTSEGTFNNSSTFTSDLIVTTSKSAIHILDQLFLQTVTCQVISGFFAWAALIITIHHVCFILNEFIDS